MYPQWSILAENPVAVIDKVVDKKGTRKQAEAYLKFLWSDEAQEIAAKHQLRPRSEKVLAKYAKDFPKVNTFTVDDALTVVYQMCNYGAPDSDVTANYTFYRVDGGRRLFNRTYTQQLSDADLPPAGAWESQAFVSQTVPLQPFPPGRYELEVQVRDRLTRATAHATVAFTVASGLR